ncbi:hypothetical protein CN1A_29 [Clavibacter phage CN1A]|uniref:Uncharacterized protein n=1 Tax=Clavibacter phage CN1A TaxID=1406793 RepID=U5PXG2_9CAUD|nr:hypothetical protein CN1A_29 [Clavibacter phage CN1A]AGY47138.1 hypothetical protein CN1A_29 [Clavibacter phage CN1A]
MTYLLSFDPGVSSGIALGSFGPKQAYEFIEGWEPQGGTEGLIEWWTQHADWPGWDNTIWVSELFVLANNDFVANIESKRGEGAIMMMAHPQKVNWQDRTRKAGVPNRILKEHGLWQSGVDYQHEDGRDVNDAIIHALEYLRSRVHIPTLKRYFR